MRKQKNVTVKPDPLSGDRKKSLKNAKIPAKVKSIALAKFKAMMDENEELEIDDELQVRNEVVQGLKDFNLKIREDSDTSTIGEDDEDEERSIEHLVARSSIWVMRTQNETLDRAFDLLDRAFGFRSPDSQSWIRPWGLVEKYKKTPAQIVLRWGIQQNTVVIPKTSKHERLEVNYQVSDYELSKEDMDLIKTIDRKYRTNQPAMFWGIDLFA